MSRQPGRDLRRQRKVRTLRDRLVQASDPMERERLIAKIQKIAPTAPVPES